jgi:hypothetical protein
VEVITVVVAEASLVEEDSPAEEEAVAEATAGNHKTKYNSYTYIEVSI